MARPWMSSDGGISAIVYQMLSEREDVATLSLLYNQRFECDIEINILRVKDRVTGKETFMPASFAHCEIRPDGKAH